VNDRIARLEESRAPPPWKTPPLVTLIIKEMNAERMELDGRPPDPANEPTPEEEEAGREASRWFLETGAALMRAAGPGPAGPGPAGPGPAALEGIAQMEEQARQNIETKGASA
jgi:hypothetical protein